MRLIQESRMRKSTSRADALIRELFADIRSSVAVASTQELCVCLAVLLLDVCDPFWHERMRELLMLCQPSWEVECWVIVWIA